MVVQASPLMAKKKRKETGRIEFTAEVKWIERLQNCADEKGIAVASLIKLWLTERMTQEGCGESADKKGK